MEDTDKKGTTTHTRKGCEMIDGHILGTLDNP